MTRYLTRSLEVSGSFLGVVGVIGVGAYHGLREAALTIDLRWLVVSVATNGAAPAVVTFAALAGIAGVLLTVEVFQPCAADEHVRDGPRLAIVVPAYRDAAVLRDSVRTHLASAYENLEVAIVVEADDAPTRRVARELAAHPRVSCLVNRRSASKAGAINDAVERIDADFFAAFDADERVDPSFAPAAMYQLTEGGRDVFQARRVPRVTGPVEAIAYCERLLFNASYKLIEPLGFTYCRSSSVAFRRDAFETVGGLSDVVTEDIDFAHKCFRHDLDVVQARNLTNEMEAPHTLGDFWRQRKRWRLGHIEVLHKALLGGFDRGGRRGFLSTVRLGTELFASVLVVGLVGKIAVLILLGQTTILLAALFAIAFVVVPVLYRDRAAGHVEAIEPTFLLLPAVYPLFGLLTIRCLFEYCVSWDGDWYRIAKTGS